MSGTETQLLAPQGTFLLHRLPRRRRELLRAWDAADEYVLRHIDEKKTGLGRILIVNDSFGALSVALADCQPQAWSDSWLSQEATRENLKTNGMEPVNVDLVDSMHLPQGPIDLAIIKVPKTMALLEDQLVRLRPLLAPESQVIVAGMIKGLSKSVWALLERIIGPTDTSRAAKKARLIFATPDERLPLPENPYPVRYTLEGTDYEITNHANVFSRDRLDIGTRFFIEHLPERPGAKHVVDLGCGNGVVGLIAAAKHPDATIHFTDESFMAIASARETFSAAFGERHAEFKIGDGMHGFERSSVDLILCNPPFHQQQAVGDHIAIGMFRQAKEALREGGELWVVGNRHLGYHVALKKLFRQCELVASNAKFIILCATQ